MSWGCRKVDQDASHRAWQFELDVGMVPAVSIDALWSYLRKTRKVACRRHSGE